MTERVAIDPDIRVASTLPAAFYRDPDLYRAQVERLFARTWHVVDARDPVPERGSAAPATLLEGCLDEPLAFTRDERGAVRCLSNVCTHRGNAVVVEAGKASSLRCRYHGRRFALDGSFSHMPEFEGAKNFPSKRDDLPSVSSATLGPISFAAVEPMMAFDAWLGPLRERLAFVPWDRLTLAEEKRYEVKAHWALYCDNYLEGFHIPFVHAGLAEALDYGSYRTETMDWSVLQIGVAKKGEETLALPAGHPDANTNVAAFYAFLFPATMINVYAWGVSLNAVRPLGPDKTAIVFWSLVHDASRRNEGVGADLHRVELEDEAVVESVQRGVRSRFYRGGRLSPSREVGVHHFHRLVAEHLEVGT